MAEGTSSPGAQAAMGGYPEGPYGEGNPELGAVVENLSFRGLLNLAPPTLSAEVMPTDVDLAAFRATDARYLLLVTAMGWCGSCQLAARDLGGALAPRVIDAFERGGLVAELLLEGTGSDAPSDTETKAWAEAAGLTVSVLGPASERVAEVFPEREWAFLVRLDTMQVVWRVEVPLYADVTVAEHGLTELERRLAE